MNTVVDFPHWDAAEEFSGQQAAALVVGLDPHDPAAELWKAKLVLERMAEGHRIAQALVSQPMTPEEFRLLRASPLYADALVSSLFDQYPILQKEPWPSDPHRPYELVQRFAGPDGEFQAQKYTRAELQRWLIAVDLRSAYQFNRAQVVPTEAAHGRWPWGDHHTRNLGYLEAAAKKFWTYYDPSDPGTASTNNEVSDWLIEEYKLSAQLAKSIASMLRADDLRSGPRK